MGIMESVITLLWVIFTRIMISTALDNTEDITVLREKSVCMGELSTASCPAGFSIITHAAMYGRMEVGRCLSAEFGFVGCTNDVMFLADRWCSGRQECEFFIPNKELDAANEECSGDLRAYMQLSYSCVSVAHTGGYHCLKGETVSLTQPEGYISSDVTDLTGCGSPNSPWRIEASAGQVIKISLIDFAALEREPDVGSFDCRDPYAYILEADLGINKTVCGTQDRRRVIYTSTSNVVELHMADISWGMRSRLHRYMIHYEFTGCPDIAPPEGAWYSRDGSEIVIGCHGTDVTWRMTCMGYDWEGEMGNCTGLVKELASGSQWFTGSNVAITSSIICLSILLVVAGLTVGICYIRRRRRRTRQLPHPYEEGHGQGRSGYATNPYYQPITFAHSPDKDSNSSDGSSKIQPPPGMSSAMAKSFMPIWKSPLPNNSGQQQPPAQSPQGGIVRPISTHAHRSARATNNKCACVKSSSRVHNHHRERDENRKNELSHKNSLLAIDTRKIHAKEKPLKIDIADPVKDPIKDNLKEFGKSMKNISNGYYSAAPEHLYCGLTKVKMVD